MMLSKTDEIRAYALERYVRPWRDGDETHLAIRGGRRRSRDGAAQRHATPNVCSALAGRKFQQDAGIVLVRREGPLQSTTSTFHYETSPESPDASPIPPKRSSPGSNQLLPRSHRSDSLPNDRWRSADLCLVSCVKSKRSAAAPARDMYVSAWFRKARACIESLGCPWYILSAKHGLLDPGSTIDPYDKTLNGMSADLRRAWARGVFEDLAPRLSGVGSVTVFAGMSYREFLEAELRSRGLDVNVPMQGLGLYQQISCLSAQAGS